MFDDDAPIWRFKVERGALEEPEVCRSLSGWTFPDRDIPALAIASFESSFCMRLGGPGYNPGRRKTFKTAHWLAVTRAVGEVARRMGVDEAAAWCEETTRSRFPEGQIRTD